MIKEKKDESSLFWQIDNGWMTTTVIKNMKCMCIILLIRERYVSRTAPPPVVIKHRTCDLSPVLLTVLIELNSGFKNIEPPPPTSRPGEYNDIQFFLINILMQYCMTIKANIIVSEVSKRRFIQIRNLDV